MRRSVSVAVLVVLTHAFFVDGQVLRPSEGTGTELSASAQDARRAVDVEATLLLPRRAGPVRGIIAVLGWGVGRWVYDDPAWRQLADELQCGLLRVVVSNNGGPADPLTLPVAGQSVRNASLGGAEALLRILDEFARQSGRPELQGANLLLWGHSAAGSFGTTFAALHPTRTIAFVRYHSHSRGLPVDLAATARVPALIFAGEKDTTAGIEDSEALWASGRAVHAPWTFAVEPGATHGSFEALKKANALAIPWMRAVIQQRLANDGNGLRTVDDTSGRRAESSWLPDEASARGWRLVTGRLTP
jgi:dienelactone hydrolase